MHSKRQNSPSRTFLWMRRNSLLLYSCRVACLVRNKKSSPFKSTTVWLMSSSLIFRIATSSSSRFAMSTTSGTPCRTALRAWGTDADSDFNPGQKNGDTETDATREEAAVWAVQAEREDAETQATARPTSATQAMAWEIVRNSPREHNWSRISEEENYNAAAAADWSTTKKKKTNTFESELRDCEEAGPASGSLPLLQDKAPSSTTTMARRRSFQLVAVVTCRQVPSTAWWVEYYRRRLTMVSVAICGLSQSLFFVRISVLLTLMFHDMKQCIGINDILSGLFVLGCRKISLVLHEILVDVYVSVYTYCRYVLLFCTNIECCGNALLLIFYLQHAFWQYNLNETVFILSNLILILKL